jgi:hypothetical protein
VSKFVRCSGPRVQMNVTPVVSILSFICCVVPSGYGVGGHPISGGHVHNTAHTGT